MEPLKRHAKRTRADDVGATIEEVEEHQALLAERFTEDPDFGPVVRSPVRKQRFDELTKKLFPNGVRQR